MISPFQSAFIPGRQMANNIVLAEEIVAAWRRDGTTDFMWKVDFAKAYDSIDCHFLSRTSSAPGIPKDVGALGKIKRYDLHLRRLGEWSAAREMDSPSERHPTVMPSGPLPFHPSSVRLGSITTVLTRGPD